MFDRIYLCLDADKEGLIATRELVERLGRHRCHIVKLLHKDANECLLANVSKEIMQQCFEVAKTLDPEELKSASEFVEQVIDEFYPAPVFILDMMPLGKKRMVKFYFDLMSFRYGRGSMVMVNRNF